MPLGRKLVPPSTVGRPWSPSVADHLVFVHLDVVVRLPLPVGVIGSEGLRVALAILVDALAPVLGNASWPFVAPV